MTRLNHNVAANCCVAQLFDGGWQLCSKSPSTAAFGNAGLISTVRYLDGDLTHDGEVRVSPL